MGSVIRSIRRNLCKREKGGLANWWRDWSLHPKAVRQRRKLAYQAKAVKP